MVHAPSAAQRANPAGKGSGMKKRIETNISKAFFWKYGNSLFVIRGMVHDWLGFFGALRVGPDQRFFNRKVFGW